MKTSLLLSALLCISILATSQEIPFDNIMRMIKEPEGAGEIVNYLNSNVGPLTEPNGDVVTYLFTTSDIVHIVRGQGSFRIPWDKIEIIEIYTSDLWGREETVVNVIIGLPDRSGNPSSVIRMKPAGWGTYETVVRYLRLGANRFGEKSFGINAPVNHRKVLSRSPSVSNTTSSDMGGYSTSDADLVQSALGDKWDFVGTAAFSALTYDSDLDNIFTYKPITKYEATEVRLRISYGTKKFRLLVSPVGMSWVVLPSYTKYDTKKTKIEQNDFGSIRYYSPSIGFSWCLMGKDATDDLYRVVEFPITFEFAPLIGGKTDKVEVKDVARDDEFSSYFKGFKYSARASMGVDLYFSDRFGLGLACGYNYVSVQPSPDILTETVTVSGKAVQRDFTFKIDDVQPFFPFVDLRLMLRF